MRRWHTALLASVFGVAIALWGTVALVGAAPATLAIAGSPGTVGTPPAPVSAPAEPTMSAAAELPASAPRAVPAGGDSPDGSGPSRGHPLIAPAGTNLLRNPGAESGVCSASGYDTMTIPGWSVTKGNPNAVCYGGPGVALSTPGFGHAYFSGGSTGDAAMDQVVDVGAAYDVVDGGQVRYNLSGELGGLATQNDRVRYGLVFEALDGSPIGQAWLPAVTNTDRGQITGYVGRSGSGVVPPGTRMIDVRLSFTWTAGQITDGYADNLSLTVTQPVVKPLLRLPPSNVPKFDHVFVVSMGNENYAQGEAPADQGQYIVGNPAAPYLNRILTKTGSLLSQMYATAHPSDPNSLAVTAGSTYDWLRDPVVGFDQVDATHLGDRVEAVGKTWTAYADGMAYPCDTSYHNTATGGYYVPDSDPFLLYANMISDPVRCAAHNKPLAQFDTDLASNATTPNFVWLAPNTYNNMSTGGVRVGDTWLSQELPKIFQSPAWLNSRSLLIVTWDEGYSAAYGPNYPNHVATYVLGSQGTVKQGYVSPLRYTQYSLGATICDALGLKTLTSNDKYAQRFLDIWPTPSGGGSLSATISYRGDGTSTSQLSGR